MTIKPNATGAVLPAGSTPASVTLPATYTVTIDGFDDSGLVRCVYPDGFVKHHQSEAVDDLAAKVVNQLRGRYGAGEVTFAAVPKAIKAGQSFTVGA